MEGEDIGRLEGAVRTPPGRGTLALALIGALVVRVLVALLPMAPGAPALAARRCAMESVRLGPLGAAMHDPAEVPVLQGLLVWPAARLYAQRDPDFVHWDGRTFGVIAALPAILADLWLIVLLMYTAGRHWGSARAAARAAWVWALNPAAILASATAGSPASIALALGTWAIVMAIEGRTIMGLVIALAAVTASPWGVLFACVTLVLGTRVAVDTDGRALARAALGLLIGFVLLLAPLIARVPARSLAESYTEPWIGDAPMTRHAFDLWFLILGPDEADERVIASSTDIVPSSAHTKGDDAHGADAADPVAAPVGPTWVLRARHVGLAIALFLLALMLVRLMGEDSPSCAWDQTGPLLLLVLFAVPRAIPGVLLWPLPFLLVSRHWRNTGWMLTGLVAMNFLYVLGPWPSWGAAAQGGWGAALAGVIVVAMVRSFVRTDLRSDGLSPIGPPSLPGKDAPLRSPSLLEEPIQARWGVRDAVLILSLTLCSGLLRWHTLAEPPVLVFDEVYHAKAGQEIFAGKSPNEWVHPPLAKILIGLGERRYLDAKGDITSKGWRFAPWIAGTLVVPFLYWLGRATIVDRRAVAVGVLLFVTDCSYFVMSRTAMTNVFAILFEVTAYLCVFKAVREVLRADGPAGYGGWMTACGLVLGLGISTRWTTVWVLGAVVVIYAVAVGARVLVLDTGESAAERLTILLVAPVLTALHLVVLPLAIYVASYYPLVRWGCYATYHFVAYLQPLIFHFHTTFTTNHPYYSQWFTWCWDHRPVWYHYRDADKTIYGIIAMGNPVLWCASLPALLIALRRALRERDLAILVLIAAYASLYVPWGLSPRVFNYSHYYLESMPYACLVMGAMLARAWDRPEEGRGEALVLVILSLLAFAFFYPILAAAPISSEAYGWRILSKFWI